MKITTDRIKEIIREELSRVNEAMSREAAEDGASMYNSEHYGLSHRQLVQMIMKHGHIDAAYPTYLEFRDGHEHNRRHHESRHLGEEQAVFGQKFQNAVSTRICKP